MESRQPPLIDLPLYRYLDTVGDGSGTKNANGNYSGGATKFLIAPPATDRYFVLHRVLITIEDAQGFDAGDYGAIAGGLTNGVLVNWIKDGTTHDLTNGIPIKTNAGWGIQCYDISFQDFGAGNNFLLVRWTFARRGQPLGLALGDSLEFVLEDDLTGLVAHYFQVQGCRW